MAFNIYLRIDGITGLSQAAGFTGQIELSSLSFGTAQTLNIGSTSSGAGAGKMTYSPITATRMPDTVSPALLEMMVQGKAAPTATISFVQDGGSSAPMKIDLKLVAVASMTTAASADGIVESLTLQCGALQYETAAPPVVIIPKPPVTIVGTKSS